MRRAIKKLEVLGNGMRLIGVGERTVVVSVPVELSGDQTEILRLAQETGWVTSEALEEQLRWLTQSQEMRADLTFDGLRTDRFQPLTGA